MLRNLAIGRYLCFLKIGVQISMYIQIFILLKGNSAIRFSNRNNDSEKFKGFRRNGGFDYIPYEGFSRQ